MNNTAGFLLSIACMANIPLASANGSNVIDPNLYKVELYDSRLVIGYNQFPESTHASGCKCLMADFGGGYPNVDDRGTLRAWYGALLDAEAQGKPMNVYRTDDWKILSISNR